MFSTTKTQKVLVGNPSVLQVVIVILIVHVVSVSTSDNANIDVDDVNVAEMMKDDDGITTVDVNDAKEMIQVRVQAMMLNRTSSKIMVNKWTKYGWEIYFFTTKCTNSCTCSYRFFCSS